ncbi:hypothetical protein GCM10011316_20790 [Roseibium aquae]|uniref:Uncharacterized protein n=1 Tax=Roseibium aquae TaxID=1323746 RepID=A0A916X0W4_9HYPH|nr:hypothetical protein GCM10011316_20790 [Roseibium aquae]
MGVDRYARRLPTFVFGGILDQERDTVAEFFQITGDAEDRHVPAGARFEVGNDESDAQLVEINACAGGRNAGFLVPDKAAQMGYPSEQR